ncbi:MAG: hypothetical protein DMF60_16185, partial [Acidobacteria bacterium]
ASLGSYKHGPPSGGRETLLLAAINMALLAEGKKSKLPSSAELIRPKAVALLIRTPSVLCFRAAELTIDPLRARVGIQLEEY